MLRARVAVLLMAVALAGSACIKRPPDTHFAATDPTFEQHPSRTLPTVYMDRLPGGSYRSVGVIEVAASGGTELSEIMAGAAEKGQEIGCDFVMERSLHRVGAVAPAKRWSVVLQLEPLLRRTPVAPHERRDWRPSNDLAQHVAPQPGVQPYYPYPVVVDPPKRREFICGVYTEAPARGKPAPARSIPTDAAAIDVARVLWTKLATSPGKACGDVYEVLAKDARCAAGQCAAPMILAQEYIGRCDEQASADNLTEIDALRERWSKEVGKQLPLTCLKALKRAATSEDAARNYGAQCLGDRAASNTERRILGEEPNDVAKPAD